MSEPSAAPPAGARVVAPIGCLFLPLLLLVCVAYYLLFASDLGIYDGEEGLWQLALNAHDHFIYLSTMERIRDTELLYEMNNDVGIALIYMALSWFLPFLVDEDLALLALVFNSVTLVACWVSYASICHRLGLGTGGKLSFFANLSLIYFAQLINKDMLTVLSFLLAVQLGLAGRRWQLLLLVPFLALVRQQLALFMLMFVFLMWARRPVPRMVFLYVVTSLVAAFLSIFAAVIEPESLGDGFSAFLIGINQQFYVGYLLLNPVRVLQYVADAYASFWPATDTGGIDAAKVLRWPQLLLLLFLARPLSTMVTRFRHWLDTPARALVLVVVAYLLAWLMNPTINARYVMLITPVLVLFALYAKRQLRAQP